MLRPPVVQCDNCGEIGHARKRLRWADGSIRYRADMNSYFELRKVRLATEAEPFEPLHFCTVECAAAKLSQVAYNESQDGIA